MQFFRCSHFVVGRSASVGSEHGEHLSPQAKVGEASGSGYAGGDVDPREPSYMPSVRPDVANEQVIRMPSVYD